MGTSPAINMQLVMNHAIATIAKTIDERILALPGSRDRLLPAIQHAIDYFAGSVAAIPGPVHMSAHPDAVARLPISLFQSADDLIAGLGRSIAVRNSINWFAEHGHNSVFAVMGTRQRPGRPEVGWTDHTFRSLGASDGDARECLCEAAFTSLVNAFATRLKERQREWHALHLNAQLPFGDISASSIPLSTPSNGPSPQQQDVFARHLKPTDDDLTAEDGLEALIEWLRLPDAQLRIDTANTHAAAIPGTSNEIALPTLSSSDRRHWKVCITEFPLREALDAIAKTPAANRYILI